MQNKYLPTMMPLCVDGVDETACGLFARRVTFARRVRSSCSPIMSACHVTFARHGLPLAKPKPKVYNTIQNLPLAKRLQLATSKIWQWLEQNPKL